MNGDNYFLQFGYPFDGHRLDGGTKYVRMIQEHLKCWLFWSNIFQKFTWFSYEIETEQDFPYQQPTNN